MWRDLGGDSAEVHAEAVIGFWLEGTPAEKRFARDAMLDRVIAGRFGALRAAVLAGHAAGWRAASRTLLAAVILLDQFSRNIFRDDARAFAADPLARALAGEAIAKRWDVGMDAEERRFLHMPFMHSEAMEDQLRSLACSGDADRWAALHAGQIARFGRFPARNAALGRANTPAEVAFLREPDAAF